MSNFQKDLKLGHRYEEIALGFFLGNPAVADVVRPTGLHKAYDFMVKDIAYEVKSDRMATKTGNFCIEWWCGSKPSGISTTEAIYYIYFVIHPDDGHDCYMIPVADIKKIISDKNYHRSIKGGDGYRSIFYLIRSEHFSKYKVYAGVSASDSTPTPTNVETVTV